MKGKLMVTKDKEETLGNKKEGIERERGDGRGEGERSKRGDDLLYEKEAAEEEEEEEYRLKRKMEKKKRKKT